MKRTSTRIVASSSGEWHISFDQIFDFDWCEDFFDKRIVRQNRNEKVINIPYYMIFYWFVKRKVKKLILEVKIRLKVRFLFLFIGRLISTSSSRGGAVAIQDKIVLYLKSIWIAKQPLCGHCFTSFAITVRDVALRQRGLNTKAPQSRLFMLLVSTFFKHFGNELLDWRFNLLREFLLLSDLFSKL